MFDGDCAQAGRRAMMDKKRAAKEAFTGKIGDFRVGGASAPEQSDYASMDSGRYQAQPSYRRGSNGNAHSDIFGGYDTKSELGEGFKITNGPVVPRSSDITNPSVPQTPSANNGATGAQNVSTLFTHRVKVMRHAYEVDVTCQLPIVDMSKNSKRRTITWVCENDDTHAATIPAAYDLEAVSMLSSDLDQGRCHISVPAVTRNVLG